MQLVSLVFHYGRCMLPIVEENIMTKCLYNWWLDNVSDVSDIFSDSWSDGILIVNILLSVEDR